MKRFETAAAAADWINGARWKGEKHGLENTRALLDALGNPERRMGRILHVAGTNGKGSTCAFLSTALLECGYRVGLFTSPYLRRFEERIQLNNSPIPEEALIDVASRVREKAEELTEKGVFCTTFELLTVCACVYYADCRTDFAVMEVGLGGRLDSTNVLPSSVSLIAAIGMDHMHILGDTVEQIAAEKAGIMKRGVPVCVTEQEQSVMKVFETASRGAEAPLHIVQTPEIVSETAYGNEFICTLSRSGARKQRISLAGAHQCRNAALALTALDLLGIDMEAASRGIAKTEWPGRLQWRGNILIDCGHNPQGVQTLSDYVKRFFTDRRVILLTGMMQDKQIEACESIFSSFAQSVVTTAVDWPRAMKPDALKTQYGDKAVAVEGVENALSVARKLAGTDGIIVAAGSVYLAGAVLNLLGRENV